MIKLKLSAIPNDRPVKITIDLPAPVFKELQSYAEAIAREGNQPAPNPAKLIVPMVARFMATDKAFRKARNQVLRPEGRGRADTDSSSS